MFPNTVDFLPDLNLLNYKAILPSIRKAFIKDLNTITFNLGRYLEAQDPNTFRSPAVYNIFLIYRILDLSMRKVELPDILAYTYGDIGRARIAVEKEVDIALVERVTKAPQAYQQLVAAFDQYQQASNTFRTQFRDAVTASSKKNFNPILDQVSTVPDSLFARVQKIQFIKSAQTLQQTVDKLSAGLSDRVQANPTAVVKELLQGKQPYAYYRANPSEARFNQLFGSGAKPMAPLQLRAAGLTALREILATETPEKIMGMVTGLEETNQEYAALTETIAEDLRVAQQNATPVQEVKTELENRITTELGFSDHEALKMLRAMVQEVSPREPDAREQLRVIQHLFEDWATENQGPSSPTIRAMAARASAAPAEVTNAVSGTATAAEQLIEAGERLRQVLNDYNNPPTKKYTEISDSLLRTYHNLATFESLFGMAREVFFLLANGSDTDLFLNKKDMSIFSINSNAKNLLAGLAQERFRHLPARGNVNPSALATLLVDFGFALSENRALQASGNNEALADRRIGYVNFITKTIQVLLEAKVFQDKAAIGSATSFALVDQYPAFAKVPAANKEIGELFALSQKGEFRFAIDNLLNLVKIFDIAPTAPKKQKRLEQRRDHTAALIQELLMQQEAIVRARGLVPAPVQDQEIKGLIESKKKEYSVSELQTFPIQKKIALLRQELLDIDQAIADFDPRKVKRFRENLFKYGGVMADIAAANNPGDIEAALNNVALPVGSSQIKRSRNWSGEFGAYFGATMGEEMLSLPEGVNATSLENNALTAALWVPVGFTLSKNIGGQKSLTLFLSLLDLGAVTAFRIGQSNTVTTEGEVEQLPEFTLANVAAPGVHLLYNFPKSPFSLGVGRQAGPSVRQFTLDMDDQKQNATATRDWMVTFSVDVPIFRLFGD
ncbi:MAG: hypothetical protein AAF840_04625 [Bacteroidota bacterium]